MSSPFDPAFELALDQAAADDWADWNRRFEEAFPPPPPEPAKNPGACKVCGERPEAFYVEEYTYPIAYSWTRHCQEDA